jgi:hypothetical protein
VKRTIKRVFRCARERVWGLFEALMLEAQADLREGRTRRGLCARCAERPGDHTNGHCPDGKGTFTWVGHRENGR